MCVLSPDKNRKLVSDYELHTSHYDKPIYSDPSDVVYNVLTLLVVIVVGCVVFLA